MRILCIGLFTLLCCSCVFGQKEKLNCIIFIDGKLPTGIYDEYFSYLDEDKNESRIDFEYSIGDIILSKNDINTLYSLQSDDFIIMNLSYRSYDNESYSYSGKIRAEWLSYDYLVIRITNLNKKKGKYYFAYSTPGIIKSFIKKEYNMFEEY